MMNTEVVKFVKLLKEAEIRLSKLAAEAQNSVEYSDWPELQKEVEKSLDAAYKIHKALQ